MSQQSTDRSGSAVNLLERNGRFFFFQPDIGVIASDNGIAGAYEKFLSARHAFWYEADAAGLTAGGRGMVAGPDPTAGPPGNAVSMRRSRGVTTELGIFVVKLLIALTLFAGIAGVIITRAAEGVTGAIDRAVGPSKSISLADVSRKAADIVKDMQSLTKEEKESLRQSVGAISRELDPFVDAWRNPPPKP
jgi:hypothetical protein